MSTYFRLMRLHQPVGIWLLLWPCWFSIALASDELPSARLLALFALGAIVMRSAGCIINDLCDRDFDKQVERTKDRPLANGELKPSQAIATLFLLLSIAFVIAWALGTKVLFWSILALPLVATYPLMKRITWWPQAFLGLTFNWGALVGWVAVKGQIELPALLLYAGCIFWTIGYDTIYAHQDKADDIKIGVKSTAIKWGKQSKIFVTVCYILFTVGLISAILSHSSQPLYPLILTILSCGLMVADLILLNLEDSTACRRSFVFQTRIATLLWGAMLLS